MILPDPIRATLLVTTVFERLGIRYLIGGSLASTIYGKVRTTQDADIVADMQLDNAEAFIDSLKSEFYIDKNLVVDAIQHHSSFNIIHRNSMFKVDVFVPPQDPYTKIQLSRAREQVILPESDIRAFFASPEDTILAKLMWFRMGGEVSEKQWEDIIGILKVKSEDLDIKYIETWAGKLNVIDLWGKALRETAGL